MTKLDIDKKDFYSYALHVKDKKGYKRNWVFAIFRANYGEWVGKDTRYTDDAELTPKKPSQDFTDWLNEYQKNFIENQPEALAEYREKQGRLVVDEIRMREEKELEKMRKQMMKSIKKK